MAAKDELGRRGENLASEFLAECGYEILERNWRCPMGEIDIVARDGTEFAFVEVKTRSTRAYGHPLEAITMVKLARLRRLSAAWCDAPANRIARGALWRIRIDAIGVIAPRDGDASIEHLKGIF